MCETFVYDSFALQMQHGWCKNQVLNAFQLKRWLKISDNFAEANFFFYSSCNLPHSKPDVGPLKKSVLAPTSGKAPYSNETCPQACWWRGTHVAVQIDLLFSHICRCTDPCNFMNTVPDLSYTVWSTLGWEYMFTTLQSDYTCNRWQQKQF